MRRRTRGGTALSSVFPIHSGSERISNHHEKYWRGLTGVSTIYPGLISCRTPAQHGRSLFIRQLAFSSRVIRPSTITNDISTEQTSAENSSCPYFFCFASAIPSTARHSSRYLRLPRFVRFVCIFDSWSANSSFLSILSILRLARFNGAPMRS